MAGPVVLASSMATSLRSVGVSLVCTSPDRAGVLLDRDHRNLDNLATLTGYKFKNGNLTHNLT